jgi:predicted metal-dependent hydrolase
MMDIEYKIARKPRRKTLSIAITPDNKILVKANNTISEKEISVFIQNKQNWIFKTLEFNRNQRKPFSPKQFITGENFLILGKQYSLSLQKSPILEIKLTPGQLLVCGPENFLSRRGYLKNKLISWYQCAAYEIIFKQVNVYKLMLNVKVKEIMIRNLKRAWANCSRQAVVTFSWRLVMAPLEIIDYVVIHELSHLIHHNHSRLFWQTVEKTKPDYKQCKTWLKVHENTFLW